MKKAIDFDICLNLGGWFSEWFHSPKKFQECVPELSQLLSFLAKVYCFVNWVAQALLHLSRWWFQICFYVHPYLGKWSNFTNIFQMGWNHQLVICELCSPPYLSWGIICTVFFFQIHPLLLLTKRYDTTTHSKMYRGFSLRSPLGFSCITRGESKQRKGWSWKRTTSSTLLASLNEHRKTGKECLKDDAILKEPTVDASEIWRSPVEMVNISLLAGFHTCQVLVWDSFHQQYVKASGWKPTSKPLVIRIIKKSAKLHAFQNSWEPSRGFHGFTVGMKVVHIFPFRWFHGFPDFHRQNEVPKPKMGSKLNHGFWEMRALWNRKKKKKDSQSSQQGFLPFLFFVDWFGSVTEDIRYLYCAFTCWAAKIVKLRTGEKVEVVIGRIY